MATIPNTDYDRLKTNGMWNILIIWIAWKQIMLDVHMKLNQGLP